MNPTAQKILAIETAEIGYFEQPGNHTKYEDELGITVGEAWCGDFQDWAFMKADALGALPLRSRSTVAAARAYMVRGWWYADPIQGDLAFLHNTGWEGHVGFVVSVNGDGTVTTLEGNTSAADGSNTHGGEVAKHRREIAWWAGFGRPNYPSAGIDLSPLTALVADARKLTLKYGDSGPAVLVLQNALHVLPAKGDFGPITLDAVTSFQKWYRGIQQTKGIVDPYLLPVSGIVDSHTWAALLGETAL